MITDADPIDVQATPRVLVIDDNSAVLDLFSSILSPIGTGQGELRRLETQLFGAAEEDHEPIRFAVDLANSGSDGCKRAADARRAGQPYAVAFVDMRMPGWDGLRTIEALWEDDAALQVVLCTAYSDHSWEEIAGRLGSNDRWLLLKKPFDAIEVLQMAAALARKWQLQAQQRRRLDVLEREVGRRMAELQRVSQLLHLIADCNEVLIGDTSEATLRVGVINRLVQHGAYSRAWIGLVDDEPARSDATSGAAALIRSGAECGNAFTALTDTSPLVARHPDEPDGLSSLTLPLSVASAVIGHLTLCSSQSDAFDQAEIKLLEQLAHNVAYGISNVRQSATRKKLERELDYHINFDHLTGLPASAVFRERVRQAIMYAFRCELQVAILVFSLDRFQDMREAWGEDVTDRVIEQMAGRLAATLRANDSICRVAAHEFAIAIPDVVRVEEVAGLSARLLQLSAQPIRIGDKDVVAATSIGVALSTTEGDDVETLIRNASSAAHCASAAGGQCFRFYAPGMNERVAARLALDADLRHALEADEFVLQYQPKVHLNSGELAGAEALLRWKHPTLGMVAPGDFIPLAEASGRIVAIGEWVIRSVCAQIRRWRNDDVPVLPVAINISARQLREGNLQHVICSALAEHNLDPGLIELEITESALIDSMEVSATTLRALRETGVRLTLDDFGTGYSSLTYLQQMPVDHVKIDRSFVGDLTINPNSAAICRGIIDLAHALQLRVIAEGAETEGQVSYLHRHGCDEIQGYYFSAALDAAPYTELLVSNHRYQLHEETYQRTLLVVDDDPHILSALTRLCRREGFRVITASSAREGLERLAEQDVQVVLSDQRMPGMNGTEFLARVRILYPGTVRIILSGYAELETVVRSINAGTLFKFLLKPWDCEDLLAHLREAFAYHELLARKPEPVKAPPVMTPSSLAPRQ